MTSSVGPQSAVDGRGLTVCGPAAVTCDLVGGPANCGSLPDLLSMNIAPPLIAPLDVADAVTSVATLPSYDMAVAASNRRTHQQQQLATVMTSSEPVVMTDSCAKTNLLSGGNTIMILPQVLYRSTSQRF